jgi:hypothetical protein
MSNCLSRKISSEGKANKSHWDEAISDPKERFRQLKYSIRVFEARKKAGEPWPESNPATQN